MGWMGRRKNVGNPFGALQTRRNQQQGVVEDLGKKWIGYLKREKGIADGGGDNG